MKTKKWIYLDLQKTGSTFLRDKLIKIFPEVKQGAKSKQKHSRERSLRDNRLRIMTIREPFEYYYSVWSYGVNGGGSVRNKIKSKHGIDAYNQIFRNENSDIGFALFVELMLAENEIDFYTRRVLNLILPVSCDEILNRFIEGELDVSLHNCSRYLAAYYPHILLPTDGLNYFFHHLYDSGKLDSMGLPGYWKTIFPLESEKMNSSSLNSTTSEKAAIRDKFPELVSSIRERCVLPCHLYEKSRLDDFGNPILL